MQERQATGFFMMTFVVVSILGILASIAVPEVIRMIDKSKVNARAIEYHNIQTAVTEMLSDSATHTLQPVGPTENMSQIRTSDTPPLVLADYLFSLKDQTLKLGCLYAFAADGTVSQYLPQPVPAPFPRRG